MATIADNCDFLVHLQSWVKITIMSKLPEFKPCFLTNNITKVIALTKAFATHLAVQNLDYCHNPKTPKPHEMYLI